MKELWTVVFVWYYEKVMPHLPQARILKAKCGMSERKWNLSISGAGHLRRRVMLGEVEEFVYKEGGAERMRRGPKVGEVLPLWLDRVERECLERMGYGDEFLVRIEGVRVECVEEGLWRMWLRVSPVGGRLECKLDDFSRWRYLV